MTFNVLDFMWFLIKFLFYTALILMLVSIIINIIIDQFRRHERRKKEIEIENALTEALKKGAFEVEVHKEKKNKN